MFKNVDPRIVKYVNDYKLNLITPDEIEDFYKFSSELGTVMQFIQFSDDSEKIHDIIEARKDESVDIRTVEMINAFAGININTRNMKGGRVMVSKAWQEIMENERTEGRAEGEDMLARLLKTIKPGSKDFEKALNATSSERKKLYKKYGIID